MRIWNPWARMTRRKLLGTLAFVAIFGACIATLVYWMVEHSEPYELAQLAIGERLKVDRTSVRLKRLGEIDFVDGSEHGHAHFSVCAPQKCFKVVAQKRQSSWQLVELQEEL